MQPRQSEYGDLREDCLCRWRDVLFFALSFMTPRNKAAQGGGKHDAETTMVAARSPEGFDGVRGRYRVCRTLEARGAAADIRDTGADRGCADGRQDFLLFRAGAEHCRASRQGV